MTSSSTIGSVVKWRTARHSSSVGQGCSRRNRGRSLHQPGRDDRVLPPPAAVGVASDLVLRAGRLHHGRGARGVVRGRAAELELEAMDAAGTLALHERAPSRRAGRAGPPRTAAVGAEARHPAARAPAARRSGRTRPSTRRRAPPSPTAWPRRAPVHAPGNAGEIRHIAARTRRAPAHRSAARAPPRAPAGTSCPADMPRRSRPRRPRS